ncbi:hypothetical protein F2981_21565 (plasmid) [Sinorhizobium meliloti]|nr:hypothetical protein [Sinorhizobium meliloti]
MLYSRSSRQCPSMAVPYRPPGDLLVDQSSRYASSWVADWRFVVTLAAILSRVRDRRRCERPVAVAAQPSLFETLAKWTPLIFFGPEGELGGFVLNLLVSLPSHGDRHDYSAVPGVSGNCAHDVVRGASKLVTRVFQYSPWLVILFYFMLMLPFQIELFGTKVEVPGWFKATLRFLFPLWRTCRKSFAVQSSHFRQAQWESAGKLAFSPPADALDDHSPPMHQTNAAALDELVLHSHDVDAADFHSRGQRRYDLDAGRALGRRTKRASDPDVSLADVLVLPLQLPHSRVHPLLERRFAVRQ